MGRITLEQCLSLERRVWDALVTGDADADRELLADDFVGVYPTGFAGRDEHSGQLAAGPTVARYTIDAATLIPVGDDAALLAYRATYRRTPATDETMPDETMPEETMYVSSLWCRRAGRWVNTFSQDTPTGAAVP